MKNSTLWSICISVCAIALILPPQACAIGADEESQLPSDQSGGQLRRDSSDTSEATPDLVRPSGTSHDRLFWTLPDFLTVENCARVPPLSPKAKFTLVFRTSFDYVMYPYVGLLAGINQATNSEPGYGQGTAGYAKRYGAAFADSTDESFWTAAILPSLLHQDPRYYQLGRGGFLHRVGYSVSRQFITRSDSGKREFNLSEIAGSAISAGISNLYHPSDDRTFANTLSVWWTQLGWDSLASVVKEFWPSIHRKLTKHRESDPQL